VVAAVPSFVIAIRIPKFRKVQPIACPDPDRAPLRGLTRKPGRDRFRLPDERAEERLTQPDNVGKAYFEGDVGFGLDLRASAFGEKAYGC